MRSTALFCVISFTTCCAVEPEPTPKPRPPKALLVALHEADAVIEQCKFADTDSDAAIECKASLRTTAILSRDLVHTTGKCRVEFGDDASFLSFTVRRADLPVSEYWTNREHNEYVSRIAEILGSNHQDILQIKKDRRYARSCHLWGGSMRSPKYNYDLLDSRVRKVAKEMIVTFNGSAAATKDEIEHVTVRVRVPASLRGGIDLSRVRDTFDTRIVFRVASVQLRGAVANFPPAVGEIDAVLIEVPRRKENHSFIGPIAIPVTLPEDDQPPRATEPPEDVDVVVFLTKTGTKYHAYSCLSLRESARSISLEEARKNYEPCKKCRPPR